MLSGDVWASQPWARWLPCAPSHPSESATIARHANHQPEAIAGGDATVPKDGATARGWRPAAAISHVRLRHTRLLVAAWVAVFVAADATLSAAKAPALLIISVGIAAVLGLIVIALLTAAEQRAERQVEVAEADPPAIDLSLRDRDELIERVWSQRITNGLERSLQHAVEMQLGLREAPELIKLSYQQTPGQAGDRVELVGAYRSAGRQLVILGAPGSGKTTQALLLMRHLLDLARRDPSAPVPEVFQLASWGRDRKLLLDWLTDELQRRHGYRPSLGRSLLVHRRIIPVLDGLDEVAREHRADCLKRVTEFWETHGGGPIVLCSRLKEYEELPERVGFGGAVTVDPPSDAQVQRYLAAAGPAWDPVRASLAVGNSSALSTLLGTPLMLSVAVLAYRERDPSELCTTHDAAEQARQLWAGYVGQMGTRSYDPVRPSTTPYTEERMMRWLSWLASTMRQANETELWLHEWAGPPAFLRKVNVANRLVRGLVVWLVVWLVFGLLGGLVVGLVVGLVFAMASSAVTISEPTYRVTTDVQRIARRLVRGLLLGLLGGLLGGLVVGLVVRLVGGPTAGLGFGLSLVGGVADTYVFGEVPLLSVLAVWLGMWLGAGLVVGLVVGLVGGLVGGLIDVGPDRTRLALHSPNQVIADSARFGLVSGLVGGLLSGVAFGLVGELVYGLLYTGTSFGWGGGVVSDLIVGLGAGLHEGVLGALVVFGLTNELIGWLGVGLVVGLVSALVGGLDAFVGHYVYRVLLWRKGWAPLRWPRFLDWACDHLYLRSTGPAYQWVHIELRNHLADTSHAATHAPAAAQSDEPAITGARSQAGQGDVEPTHPARLRT
jgi:hypothetical protein